MMDEAQFTTSFGLSRRKNPPLTYKISAANVGQWVVKFNPLGPVDPWYDVKKEYGILQGLYPTLPVPKPIYASTDTDEGMVGTAFIVIEYVQVCSFKNHDLFKCYKFMHENFCTLITHNLPMYI